MAEQATGTSGGLPVEGLPAWQFERRRRIVDAALKALERQEYEQVQVRDVAQEAGVALGTLYRYFSSKEHLYAAVLLEWSAFGAPRRARAAGTPAERVRRRTHAIVRAIERQPQFFKVYVLLRTSADANAKALLREFAAVAQASLVAELDTVEDSWAEDCAVMIWSIVYTLLTEAIYEGLPMREVHRVVDGFVDRVASAPS